MSSATQSSTQVRCSLIAPASAVLLACGYRVHFYLVGMLGTWLGFRFFERCTSSRA